MIDEQAVLFGKDQSLVGVVSRPTAPARVARVAAVFINAGVVHRVGPNRIYVTTARALAERGMVAARFDLSGIGDSPASLETAPFEQAAVGETREVMTRLQAMFGVDRFILLGICSGGVVSFKTALADERVSGAVLINPQGLGGDSDWNGYVRGKGRARRVLRDRLLKLRSWRRALAGQSDYRLIISVALTQLRAWRGPGAAVTDAARTLAVDFRTLRERGVRLLAACSEDDEALDYLKETLGPDLQQLDSRSFSLQMLPAADHSLTMKTTQEMFLSAVHRWAASLADATEGTATGGAGVAGAAPGAGAAPYGLPEGAV
jgi:alpha-beta hydrolase superfamily lysophospholipase